MNENLEYEFLVQDIFQTLANENDSNTINVKHNVKMAGRSGQKHQIDVYYEFSFMGQIHKVVIECKNYSNPVSIGKLSNFHGVLSDIGDVKGIFVSKNGFQKGAIDFARFYNITLKELRYPKASDWTGRIREIIINLQFCDKKITSREFVFDKDWYRNKYGDQKISFELSALNNDVLIKDERGKINTNLFELEKRLKCFNERDTYDLIQEFNFKEAFLFIPEQEPLKINAIKYRYDIIITNEEVKIEGNTISKAIMIDVLNGERRLFSKEI